MQTLLHPKWILLVNTVPILLALLFFGYQFQLIESFLNTDSIKLWRAVGLYSIGLLLLTGIIGYVHKQHNKSLSYLYAILVLLAYIFFLFFLDASQYKLIPRQVARWRLIGNTSTYVTTALMPTLAHALLILIIKLTPNHKESSAWQNFFGSLSIPLLWYFFLQLALPFWQFNARHLAHYNLKYVIGLPACVAFIFFLGRCFYIAVRKSTEGRYLDKSHLLLLFTIIFPIIGLLLSQPISCFGDFRSGWFFGLATLNGILLCWEASPLPKLRLTVFVGRCALLTFSLYFFIVFLPYLPFSVAAILIFGVGILMITPIILIVLHLKAIKEDIYFLSTHYSHKMLYTLAVAAFMIIPTGVTLNYAWHKHNLHQALDYVYHSNYAAANTVNKNHLQKTIKSIRASKRNSFLFENNNTPFLSAYYNWLVLDHLTISTEKIDKLESIFLGINKEIKPWQRPRPAPQPTKGIDLTSYKVHSRYDPDQDAYRSWVDLELTNYSHSRFGEYATTLDLPTGAWICDYYLYVGDRKDFGLLTEKRAAKWIYSTIRNINRDPGILYYLGGNKIRFKVFPFAKDEVRKTGFEILHKEPFVLEIDGQQKQLGERHKRTSSGYENDDVLYVTAAQKKELNFTARTPYFHFIIDASRDQNIEPHINNIKNLCHQHRLSTTNCKVTFANTDQTTLGLDAIDTWQTVLETFDRKGGFFLDRAIKKTFYDAYQEHTSTYPIVIVLSDKTDDKIAITDTEDWDFAYPEGTTYYKLDNDASLLRQIGIRGDTMLYTNPLCLLEEQLVREYIMEDGSHRYLADNNQGSILLKRDHLKITDEQIAEKSWASGLLLQAKHQSHILHPELVHSEWTSVVRQSLRSRVMTPLTSYIVLETEAQKQRLLKKQKEILAGHKGLDADNQVRNMSEPPLWLMLLFIFSFLAFMEWNKRSNQLV